MTPSPIRGREGFILEHCGMDAVRRGVTVEAGLDVEDDLLAHVDAAFERGRAHMRQHHDLIALEQLRVRRRLMLENVEASTGQLVVLDHASERVLVDHLAARGVDAVSYTHLRAHETDS